MEFVDKLLYDTEYISILEELKYIETDRFFCKHGLSHLLATARIMWIFCLEQGIEIEKELVYLAALLHDIGRVPEHKYGIPHDSGSILLGEALLRQIGYDDDKIQQILSAIDEHSGHADQLNSPDLSILLKKADKLSRNCFACQAKVLCKWEEDKKNKTITT